LGYILQDGLEGYLELKWSCILARDLDYDVIAGGADVADTTSTAIAGHIHP